MANRLSVLGTLALLAAVPASASTFFQFVQNPGRTLALLAAVPASASTFFQFVQNPGTPSPLVIVADYPSIKLASGYTTVSLTDAPIQWDMPSTLGVGMQAGLLSFKVTTTKFAVGDTIAF